MTEPVHHMFKLLPKATGVGYKPQHFQSIMDDPAPIEWLEIHAENYMGQGGRPLAQLRVLAERFAFSVHGVGLSIGSETDLNRDHLDRLKALCDWLQPAQFSEHLAWSTHDSHFLNDLLPLPYTSTTLDRIVDHVDQVQNHLGRTMLLENPSSYLAFAESTFAEYDFMAEISKRSGCGLLLDVNNVFVSATNLNYDPRAYIDAFPVDKVGEIHLGGHDEDEDSDGSPLLIDSHGREITDPVWALYDYTISKTGRLPTLIEWDTDVPEWQILADEARRADAILSRKTQAAAE